MTLLFILLCIFCQSVFAASLLIASSLKPSADLNSESSRSSQRALATWASLGAHVRIFAPEKGVDELLSDIKGDIAVVCINLFRFLRLLNQKQNRALKKLQELLVEDQE